ncbi:hypothetical protein ABIE63_002750 [Limibacillus sp. MBR-115]
MHTPKDELSLSAVEDLDVQGLRELWNQCADLPSPPSTLSKDLLARGLAYAQQVAATNGLSRKERAELRALANKRQSAPRARIKAGTRLLRLWKGRTHDVLVLEDGFLWEGQKHESLSEVARAITGTRWSGPRFFGLKGQ